MTEWALFVGCDVRS